MRSLSIGLGWVLPFLLLGSEAQAFYNPNVGRWPSRDPLGDPGLETVRRRPGMELTGEPSRYLFVRNDPNRVVDRDGLDVIVLPLPPFEIPAPSPGVAIGCSFAAGYAAGWYLDELLGISAYCGPRIGDLFCRSRSGKWQCHAICNVQPIGPTNCPERVRGNGSGNSEGEACRHAKRNATQSTPPGCYPRHCRCICVKLR